MEENDDLYYSRHGFSIPIYMYSQSFTILKIHLKICLFSNGLSYTSSQLSEDFIEAIYDENDLLELALDILGIVPDDSDEYSRDDYYNVWFSRLEEKHEMGDSEIDIFVKEYIDYVFDKREPEFEKEHNIAQA